MKKSKNLETYEFFNFEENISRFFEKIN